MNNNQAINRDHLTYRQSSSALVIDKVGRVLIVQKNSYKENEWDIPGGGILEGEEKEKAITRELVEELGTNKFEIIKASKQTDKYEWPDEVIIKRMREKRSAYRGQERVQFLVSFTGEEIDIKPQTEELKTFKWVFPKELTTYLVFPNQMEKMKKLLEEFEIEIK